MEMESEVVELRIRKVSLEDDEPVVILEDRVSERRLVLPIGPFEASAIIMEMEGITPPRPLTHDLLAELFTEAGFFLDGVELFGESADTAQALLLYHKGLRKYERAVRPSDALALALRLEAPISATCHLLASEEVSLWRRPKVLQIDQWRNRALRAQ
jgi:Uncharacterized conserved protein